MQSRSVGVVVWAADSYTDLQKRICITVGTIYYTYSVLSKVAKWADLDTLECGGISVEIVGTGRVTTHIVSILVIG